MPLSPVVCHTTGHNHEGRPVILPQRQLTPFYPFGPDASNFQILHAIPKVPADNTRHLPPATTNIVPRNPPNGAIVCTTDIPPGKGSPMHRTVSVDYAVVLEGEIVLKVEGGDEVTVKQGEVILQRGAMHSWFNASDKICRIFVVMVATEKIVTDAGETLDQFFPGPPK